MKPKLDASFFTRVAVYVAGMLVLAFGVAVATNSDLGVSPVSTLPYVISEITGMGMGLWVAVVFSFYILLQMLILKQEFQWVQLFQLPFSILFGYFVDFARWVLQDWAIPTYAGRLAMLALSILCIALGVSLYISANLVPMAMEGVTLALAKKVPRLTFPQWKVVADCAVVGIGAVLSLVFLGRLAGIREGTLVTALAVGKLVGLLQKHTDALVRRLAGAQKS